MDHSPSQQMFVTGATDGDTIAIHYDGLPQPLNAFLHVRILGVDCAEKTRPRCDWERTLAHQAYTFTATTLLERTVKYIRICAWDKYAGRVLGDVLGTKDSFACRSAVAIQRRSLAF